MDNVRVALVVAQGNSREAYVEALESFDIKYDIVSSVKDLSEKYYKIKYNGFLLDVPTLLRARAGDKSELNSLIDNFPVLRLNNQASGMRCIPAGRFAGDVNSLKVFLEVCCQNFPPRSLRGTRRTNRVLNVLLHRNINSPTSVIEKSVAMNFSPEGGFFFTVAPWKKGEIVWIVVRELTDKTPIKSRVQWVAPWGVKDQVPGIGVQFLDLSDEQSDQMEELIQEKRFDMSELKEDKSFNRMLDCMARGILVGGSVGAIAGWFFMDLQRALFLGMLVGCVAGITMKNVRDKRDAEKESENNK